MTRVRTFLLAGIASLLFSNASAQAQAPSDGQTTMWPQLPVSDVDLDHYRGGFIVADGITLGFGAVTKTFVDGELVLATQITWGDTGAQIQNTTGPGVTSGGAALSPSVLSALSASGIRVADLGSTAYTTPDGASAVIQNAAANQLSNLVVNTASNRSISQDTNVTLTLPGFQATQAQMSQAMMASALALAASNAAVNALHH